VPEDVARETFCSACSPRVGGNNTGYVAPSGPDWPAGSRLHCESASYPTHTSDSILSEINPIFIIPSAARRHERLATDLSYLATHHSPLAIPHFKIGDPKLDSLCMRDMLRNATFSGFFESWGSWVFDASC